MLWDMIHRWITFVRMSTIWRDITLYILNRKTTTNCCSMWLKHILDPLSCSVLIIRKCTNIENNDNPIKSFICLSMVFLPRFDALVKFWKTFKPPLLRLTMLLWWKDIKKITAFFLGLFLNCAIKFRTRQKLFSFYPFIPFLSIAVALQTNH